MVAQRGAFALLIVMMAVVLAACSARIPYNEVVIPEFKKMHPSAEPSQIYPIGGYGAESYTGGKTDIVIHFREGGQSLEETWTVTRKGSSWDVRFKCKSAGNVCIENKGGSESVK